MTVPCPVPITGSSVTLASEIPYGVGASYAVSPQKFDLVVEGFGSVPLSGTNYYQLEAIGGVKLYLARNSFLSLGAGWGLARPLGLASSSNYAGNPDLRAFIGIVFEPNIGDRDGDGIKDDVDKCPDEPEDFDGFEDEDGCPDPDNDHDGIPDELDKCPNVPENKNGIEDEDGCPEGVKNDRDGDGIPDDVDKCPDDPEDFDGFQDADGCPDPDNDGDGFPDKVDKCPNDPETVNGYQDEDGCPDVRPTGGPEERNDRIDLKGAPVSFGKDGKLTPAAKQLLGQVAQIIKAKKLTVRVEVHVPLGTKSTNAAQVAAQKKKDKQLAQARAKVILDYLVSQGVGVTQLQAVGIGSDRPLGSANATDQINDRVDFIKAQQGAAP